MLPQDSIQVAKDIPGAEGPVFDRAGVFHCVAPQTGHVLRIEPRALTQGGLVTPEPVAQTGGIPAGLQVGPDGSIWIADMRRGILRMPSGGAGVESVVTEFQGQAIRGCNDLSFDSLGNLYFTAPAGSGPGVPAGELFCRLVTGEVRRLDGGFEFCNGIAVSPDDRFLIVAETWTKRLWAYNLPRPGVAAGKRLWATLHGNHFGGPDGIDFAPNGTLLATNWGGATIDAFNEHGDLLDRIAMPFDRPSNLHFSLPQIGSSDRELWVTEHTTMGVWRCRWP